jgi:predicted nuclease with TOPRIM domain
MSKMIRTWSDVKDIIIAVHETLNELSKREDLIGWIPGNQAVTGAVAEQLASLAKENSDLRKRLSEVSEPTFQGLTFDQLCEVLRREEIDLASVDQESAKAMSACAEKLGDSKPSLLHLF